MTKAEYIQFHEDSCKKMVEITKRKNADYTGVGDDPFANFSRVEQMGICTVTQGFLVRMADKLSRLSSFSQRGSFLVTDESFEDTCLDLANYSILLSGFVKSLSGPKPSLPCLHKYGLVVKDPGGSFCVGCGAEIKE